MHPFPGKGGNAAPLRSRPATTPLPTSLLQYGVLRCDLACIVQHERYWIYILVYIDSHRHTGQPWVYKTKYERLNI